MTFLEAIQSLCDKLDISYTNIASNDLFTLDELKSAINQAIQRVWDYTRWSSSEGCKYTQTASGSEYYDYPDDFISGSIRILKVQQPDGTMKEYTKLNFKSYQKYLEEDPTGKELYFSSYKRFFFINPNTFTGAGLTIEIWGKERASKLTADADLMPFSPDTDDEENSGNEATVKMAYSIILSGNKKKEKAQAKSEENEAYSMLKLIGSREEEDKSSEQAKNAPRFIKQRLFGYRNSSRHNNNTGNFNI